MTKAEWKKTQQRWVQKKASGNSHFHKVREIKTRQDHLLTYSDCFTYQATSFQLFIFHIQPNNLHLTYASIPKKSVQHNQSSTTLLSADAALILISELQNAFRKWNMPPESGTAFSKEGSFAFTCHVKYLITFANAFG